VKICLVSPYDLSLPGGVNKHVRSLAERLRAKGDEVEVMGPATSTDRLGAHVTGFRGVVSIHANNSDNRIGLFTSPAAVARYMRQGAFDVVHVHEPLTPPLPFYVVWASKTVARVCTFHRYSEDEGVATRTARRILAPHLRAYDTGIAVSEAAAQYARVAWPRQLTIVPNGVDAGFFAPPADRRAAAPGSKLLKLLFVGQRMDQRKGFSVLLQAFDRIRANGVAASLDVVGYGGTIDANGRPQDAPANLPGVTFHGILDEAGLRHLMHGVDALVAPALGCESFGMVLIEAMAAGRAVVCSDIEGYRQVASPGGTVLVPPGDVARLADALAELARSPERWVPMGGRNAVYARQYDWGLIASQVRAVYSRAVEAAAVRGATPARSRAFPGRAPTPDLTPQSDDAGAGALREI
jgi:phosphatidyl-myo-inositol alpha-mannosyltransferase